MYVVWVFRPRGTVGKNLGTQNQGSVVGRDRIVVSTLRCGRSNPGSNPGHGMAFPRMSMLEEQCLTLPCSFRSVVVYVSKTSDGLHEHLRTVLSVSIV